MEDLIIEPTKKTPCVAFYAIGKLSLIGSSYPENASEFYDPLVDWIKQLKAEEIEFDLNLEYINSASANRIVNILKIIDTNSIIREVKINWFYEEGDVDNLETGETLKDLLKRTQFNFVKFQRKEE